MANRWYDIICYALLTLSIWGHGLSGDVAGQVPTDDRSPRDAALQVNQRPLRPAYFQQLPDLHQAISTASWTPPEGVLPSSFTHRAAEGTTTAKQWPITSAGYEVRAGYDSPPVIQASRSADSDHATGQDVPEPWTSTSPTPGSETQSPWDVRTSGGNSEQARHPSTANGSRPPLIFQPAVPATGPRGLSILRPTVRLAEDPTVEVPATRSNFQDLPMVPLDAWSINRNQTQSASDFPSILSEDVTIRDLDLSNRRYPESEGVWPLRNLRQLIRRTGQRLARQASIDLGVGYERLPFALFEIDSSQPLNNFRLRFDSAYDWEHPARAEYLWSKPGGKGPALPESSVDYQDIRVLMEMGGERMSVGTEIPLRFLNPTVNANTGGLSDMLVVTKAVLIDADRFQLTQVLKTQMNTGGPQSGLGNGHVSMEPGLVSRYRWNQDTLMHGELKFWFPLGGDPEFSGEVLRLGYGVAHVLYDSDTFAVLPTLEFVNWSVLSGRKIDGPNPQGVRVDGENIFNMHPGVRLVFDRGGDLGLFETGVSSGFGLTDSHWYRSMLRFDVRWSF